MLDLHTLNNAWTNYLTTIAIFFALLFVFKIIEKFVINKLDKMAQKTKTNIDDILIKIIKNIKPPVYFFIALYCAMKFLNLHFWVNKIINGVFIIIVVYQIAKCIIIKKWKKGELFSIWVYAMKRQLKN